MRLIDAEATLMGLDTTISFMRVVAGKDAIQNKAVDIFRQGRNFVAEMPTIDAVPVVRCKDCKYRYEYEDWDRSRQESFVCHECRLHQKDFGEDGFCSYGERKDGDGNGTAQT